MAREVKYLKDGVARVLTETVFTSVEGTRRKKTSVPLNWSLEAIACLDMRK